MRKVLDFLIILFLSSCADVGNQSTKSQDDPLAKRFQNIEVKLQEFAEKHNAKVSTVWSKKNCKKAETIILDLINQLGKVAENDFETKEELIKQGVLNLNELNDSLDGTFIETGEREELCDLFDNIADAVGLNVQDYQDGIASKWRDW
jgi:hypothetical protein